jgi:hypothetical protein
MAGLNVQDILKMEEFLKGSTTKLTKINKKISPAVVPAAVVPAAKVDLRKPTDPIRLQLKKFIKLFCDQSGLFYTIGTSPIMISTCKDLDTKDLMARFGSETYKRFFGTFTTSHTFHITGMDLSKLTDGEIKQLNGRESIEIAPFPKGG